MGECLIRRRYKTGPAVEIVPWATGTDAQIAAMVAAADAGKISLTDHWSVGDKRTVHLSAMTAGNALTAGQPEQDVVLVLMDTGANSGYKDVNDKTVNFVWGQENSLSQYGRINTNDTNNGSWNGCYMRADLNSKYYNALPAEFRACLKQFKTVTATSWASAENQISLDYIALFAEKEVLGSCVKSNATEAAALTQIEYYKTDANRIKQVNGSNTSWWGRSLYSGMARNWCFTQPTGTWGYTTSYSLIGVAPFGCI